MSEKTEPVRVIIRVEAHPTEETYEISRSEWDAMTPEQRGEYIQGMVDDEINNAGGAGWHIEDPDDLDAVG